MIAYDFLAFIPNSIQKLLWNHSNALNRAYNHNINQRKTSWKNHKINIYKNQQQHELIELKEHDPILKEIFSQVVQEVTNRVDNAYKSYFRRLKDFSIPKNQKGEPNYRSCKNFFGIKYPQKGYKIDGNKFITKTYGIIKFHKHTEIKGNIKQVYLTCKNNKWYLIVTTDYEREKLTLNNSVGIDVGITNLVATSDEKIIKNYYHAKYFSKQINKLKSKRDKLKKGSRKCKFYSKVISRLYDVKNRKINDFQHKVSHGLSRKYDTIFIEKLNLKDMSESEKTWMNRELRDAKIAQFISFLKYKVKTIIEVNPYNTSKICCKCGKIHDMPLEKRQMNCECGNNMDRDINAAKNIYCLGQAILSGECTLKSKLEESLAFWRG